MTEKQYLKELEVQWAAAAREKANQERFNARRPWIIGGGLIIFGAVLCYFAAFPPVLPPVPPKETLMEKANREAREMSQRIESESRAAYAQSLINEYQQYTKNQEAERERKFREEEHASNLRSEAKVKIEKLAAEAKAEEERVRDRREWEAKLALKASNERKRQELSQVARDTRSEEDKAFDAEVAQAEMEALALYPSAAIADSPLISRMHSLYRDLETRNDPLLYTSNLALVLAHRAADQLKIAPVDAWKPAQKRVAVAAAPAPAPQYAPRPAYTGDPRYAKSPINPYALMSTNLREAMLPKEESPYDELEDRMDQMENDLRRAEIDAQMNDMRLRREQRNAEMDARAEQMRQRMRR